MNIKSISPVAFTATGPARPSQPAVEPARPRIEPRATAFGPISMYSALQRGQVPIRSRPWFGWFLAIPPLGFALLALAMSVVRRREQRSTTSGAIQRKLLRGAQTALDSDDPRAFYDRIVAAIHHALDAQLGDPVGGLPHAELRAHLSAARR